MLYSFKSITLVFREEKRVQMSGKWNKNRETEQSRHSTTLLLLRVFSTVED